MFKNCRNFASEMRVTQLENKIIDEQFNFYG
jgi:hypothetical protein